MTKTEGESARAGSGESSRGWEAVLSHRASLSALRHELRTPLNAIIGYSEMLLEDAREHGYGQAIPDLEKIHAVGKELLELVNDTLDSEKARAYDLDSHLQTVGAELDFRLRTRLNAIIGYSEMLLEDAVEAKLEHFVSDLGKTHEAAERFLALIADVTETSSRAIDLGRQDSDDALVIHGEAIRSARALEDESRADSAESCSVLVVDDEEMNRDVLSRHLERQGYAVAAATNGREALEMMNIQYFDLVLLDIVMPEMDGYQVLRRLKSEDRWRDIPVIVVSALDEMDSVVRCIEMGAEDYLPKPFNPVLLRARTNACLEKKRVRDREVEYLGQVACVTDAAAAIEAEMFEPGSLAVVAKRSDALGQLARVFLRMAQEVYAREQLLRQEVRELKIELDEARQARQVAEITDTEYFQQLEAKAEDLRKMIDGV